MKIVWLASYPKSGNTFLRMLLYTYLYGEIKSTQDVARIIPDIHMMLSNNQVLENYGKEQTVFVKSHFGFSKKHPYSDVTSGCIYILRDPRDVLLSNARYLGATENPDTLRKFAIHFIINLGELRWRNMGIGSWPEHLASWLYSSNNQSQIYIKYEDLRLNTADTLRQVIKFLGETPDETKIHKAVDWCAIDNARHFELAEKKAGGNSTVYAGLANNATFIGEGKVGQSLSFIGDDIEALYQEKFGKFVSMFGY